jgi:hypothetical protein
MTAGSRVWNRVSDAVFCGVEWAELGPDTWTAREVPHSPQNFEPDSFLNPHCAQQPESDVPHWLQNFRPSRFSCWHLRH